MIASVWDWDRLEYDYFEVPGKRDLGGWKPLTGLGIQKKSAQPSGELGAALESVLPALPLGAKKVGHGVQARGAIMVKKPLLAGLGATLLEGNTWIFPTLVGATAAFFVTRLVPQQKFPGAVIGFALGLGAGIELSKERNGGS